MESEKPQDPLPCSSCGRPLDEHVGTECPKAPRPKIVHFDDMPSALKKQRTGIRDMMQDRCAMPGCPIPLAMANRAADWIMMLAVYRANRRRISGRTPYPNQETLANDIRSSAEAVELVFLVAAEEVAAETPIIVPEGAQRGGSLHLLVPSSELARRRAGGSDDHDPERGLPGGEPEGPPGDDGPDAA